MSPNGHYGDWYTEPEAAARLGISLRSFQRLVHDGASKEFAYAPERQRRARAGAKPQSVYNPEQVDALVRTAQVRMLPEEFRIPDKADGMPPAFEFAFRLFERLQEQQRLLPPPAPVPVTEKLFLTIAEASEVSGLSKAFLRRVAPRLGIRDGRVWKIPRAHLANSAGLAKLTGSPKRRRKR
jgi:hypothetical protein